jgi:type II secretory pathway component GspD/PulD (secretin)
MRKAVKMTENRYVAQKVLFPVIFILLFGFFVIQGSELTDITVRGTATNTEVVATFDEPVSYTEFVVENKLIYDLLEVENGLEANKFGEIDRGGVDGITLIPFYTANLLRLTIDVAENIEASASSEGNQLIVRFANPEGQPFEPWVASQQEITAENLGYEETYDVLGYISMDFENANIKTVLRAMAHYGGKNVVAGEEVKGNITLKLGNVSWRRAFDVIVKTAGFFYKEEENIIRVAKGRTFDEEMKSEEIAQPEISKVYSLSFADPKEVQKNINKILSQKGATEVDERTNSIIVSDIESRHERIKELVKILDAPNPQVDIEVRVVDVDFDFGRDLGITWSAHNLRSREWNVAASGTLHAAKVGVVDLTVGTVRSFADISATLNLSEREGKTKTIANPRITALNNREAEILGGKKFPVNMRDQAGNVVTRYFEVGTKLEVTPHINSQNEVTMDIHAELSNVDPTSLIITSTEATTRQLVKDGETVVLGGFVREEEQQSEQGVPILRSIPILGMLFKSTGKSAKKREVLIFLTPHIIKSY